MSAAGDNILVVGPAWVGDMVMAQSLFIALKQRNPDCRIDVLAPAWSQGLLEHMPEVGRTISLPLGHGSFAPLTRIRLGLQLRPQHYRQAIVLPNSWKSALTPFFARIPLRSGYIGEVRYGLLNDARRLNRGRLSMTVQRFVALAQPANAKLPPAYPLPRLAVSAAQQHAIRSKFALHDISPVLALCPGAEYGPAKRWPAEHYAELAQRARKLNWQIWLFGSDKDQPVTAGINALTGGICHDFSGRTTLGEAVELLSLTDAVVSNDSGLMHVAAALNKKLVAIYGSSDPGFTPPLNADATIVDLNLPCSPCFLRECPLQHTRCLYDITPDQIMQALDLAS